MEIIILKNCSAYARYSLSDIEEGDGGKPLFCGTLMAHLVAKNGNNVPQLATLNSC